MKELIPVKLNIYKLTNIPLISILGISIYHTGIEYAESEFAFGYNSDDEGIYDIKPLSYNDKYKESILLGECNRRTFFKALEKLKGVFNGKTYNILFKNCNHFTNSLSMLLFKTELPSKYSKFLAIGDMLREVF
jgi:hypothetical protein